MSAAEYRFDGIEQWEETVSQVLESGLPEEFRKLSADAAEQFREAVNNNLQEDTGQQHTGWRIGDIRKKDNVYYMEIYSNADYAKPVIVSLQELPSILPGKLQKWLKDFLNSNNIV